MTATGGVTSPSVATTYVIDTSTRCRGSCACSTRIRKNFRLQPRDGSLIQNDPDLTPSATTTVVGAAYDRNVATAMATTLFAIDRSGNELVRIGGVDGIPSPIDGEVTSIGPLGFTLHSTLDAGFDTWGAWCRVRGPYQPRGLPLSPVHDQPVERRCHRPRHDRQRAVGGAHAHGCEPPEPPTGEQGPAGPQGSAGPQGPARPQGSPGSGLATGALYRELHGRARRALTVRMVATACVSTHSRVRGRQATRLR